MISINFLIFAPFILAVLILFSGVKLRNILVIGFVLILSLLSIDTYISGVNFSYTLPSLTNTLFVGLDILLLLYFLSQGIKKSDKLVSVFAISQMILYAIVLSMTPQLTQPDILSDELSSIMYLVINIVGGFIIVYALEYIETENFTRIKKNSFIALLIFFIGVMNFLVTTNNIEIFFLLFETTTLFSYLLIRYRGDEIAVKNSLKALWMNQVGGVAILLALIFSISNYDTVYFSELLAKVDDSFLLPIVFLIIAAYVKGAAFPFQNWLLGAMVAPTPVSAILHSATMVKIAPYLILKLAPSFTPFISITLSLFGAFVFVGASIMALNRDFFKEILGLSTVALLSLMMALAAIGTKDAMDAAIILLVFHAISKALLFLQAGVLEKIYHLKYISEIDGLINIAPKTLFFIIVGFASLTLPPFGAFVGKFLAISAISDKIQQEPMNVLVLALLVVGSVFLTILYFKVTTKLFTKEVFAEFKKEKLPFKYFISSLVLSVALLFGFVSMFSINNLSGFEIVIPLILIAVTPFMFKLAKFKDVPRVKEYNCGEKDEFEVSPYYYSLNQKQINMMMIISIVFIVITLVGGII